MRASFNELTKQQESDRLLTTGEAAAMLGVSRQHIVNLTKEGILPFTLVGSHRRLRLDDLEAIRGARSRMTRDQLRSLWLGHAVAARVVEDPDRAIRLGLDEVARMGGNSRLRQWANEWELLLRGSVEAVLLALTSPSVRSRELRQNSPLGSLLSEGERRKVLDAFNHRHPGRGS